jgi:hypothetical protein
MILAAFSNASLAQNKQQTASPPQTRTADLADDGIPVLLKHLPDWKTVRERASVATNLQDLQAAAGNRIILDVIDFSGGVEAVTANYDAGKLVIVELPTPQSAFDVDARINAKLAESPNTIYRKVGNYAVFVFDAPDASAANSLIDQIKYQKTVQWLGDNPYPLLQAQRAYANTAADIVLVTIKVAGFAIIAAFALGGFFGTLIFFSRRRQQNSNGSYSDAGGMLRLNLDDLSAQTDSSRLIESGQ